MAEGEVLDVAVSTVDGVATILVRGELDVFSRRLLTDGVSEALRSGPSTVVVDLEGVTFLDGSGLRTLVQASAQVRNSGRQFEIRHPSAVVARVGRLVNLADGALPLDSVERLTPGLPSPGSRCPVSMEVGRSCANLTQKSQ